MVNQGHPLLLAVATQLDNLPRLANVMKCDDVSEGPFSLYVDDPIHLIDHGTLSHTRMVDNEHGGKDSKGF
jgi:hypothetical protein